jgi:peptidoglycan/LPS O-acetylase OafA/YrhL
MNVAITVDHTSSGKEHFEVLDGLRGGAAFLIVLFHVFNYPVSYIRVKVLKRSAPLRAKNRVQRFPKLSM